MKLLDGRAMAADVGRGIVDEVERLAELGVTPTLAAVLPGADPAELASTRPLERAASQVGVVLRPHELPGRADGLAATLARLADDPAVHGVLVRGPLPEGMSSADVGTLIPPAKDVDGMSPASLGRLAANSPAFAPAAAAAVVEILIRGEIPLAGARACVIGRSPRVGQPVALLLLAEDATVTVCHSRTKDLTTVAHEADVLVAAVGRPRMVGAGFVRAGATVIDVGANVTDDGLVGDVDADAVSATAGALTPVPGGVGPVATMMLLRHTVAAARAAAQAG
ncbi:MAG: bifunctional 5,10-methylenetetrahydrofolate dehydrogenase/5,10-methenyltetrahydrofolate cyclohydrolase [Frankia sp.]|nr:bifunctional 5,10-methylenetetrahydrofolate dehydrogenase/5,10-methenyltetrahydrofolate cyclohydrolase [Frankia sp.]